MRSNVVSAFNSSMFTLSVAIFSFLFKKKYFWKSIEYNHFPNLLIQTWKNLQCLSIEKIEVLADQMVT